MYASSISFSFPMSSFGTTKRDAMPKGHPIIFVGMLLQLVFLFLCRVSARPSEAGHALSLSPAE